jgi:dihydrofolate reductase
MHMSVDGFVGGVDGKGHWLFHGNDPAAIAWTVDTIRHASLHIMGSRTFRDMAAHWPTSTDVFAPPMNEIPKAVFSKQGAVILKDTSAAALKDAARAKDGQQAVLQPGAESWANPYVAGGDIKDEIARLKAQEGSPMMAHGGAGFARSLVALGLIDEYHLLVHPVALGKGLPLFSELASPRPLALVNSLSFPGGAVAQIYRHKQAAS